MERDTGSWTGRLNIITMSILPILFYRFNTIQIKIPAEYFLLELNKLILIFIYKGKGTRIAKITENIKVGGSTLTEFQDLL